MGIMVTKIKALALPDALLRRYFGPLYVRNGGRGQWKQFLMYELGATPAARLGAGFV